MIDPRDCWRTPRSLFERLDRRFGFVWDLAADADNALCARFLDEAVDALSVRWSRLEPRGAMFLNPPFSMLPEFVGKVAREMRDCRDPIVVLMPGHRHEQDWFHRHVLRVATEILVPRRRVAYEPAAGIKKSSPRFASLVAVYDRNNHGSTTIQSLED